MTRPCRRPALHWLAQAALLALAASPAARAQTAPTPEEPVKVQRVEVTGTAIKRVDGDSALPLQTITREEIQKVGVTTAAELLSRVAATANNLTDGGSIQTGGFHDQTGFNGANLRGIGVSSTLVLLNGRRMANFASPGDDAGVDLNNIPAAAIDKVEILLDGASAIYGTDAIGGVINFITRRDWSGVEVSVHGGMTEEGGGGKSGASIAAGWGSMADNGFNVFGVVDLQRTERLSTNQRQFISDLRIPERLPHLLSSAPWPGNLRLSGSQLDTLAENGFMVNGRVVDNRTISLAAPECNPPHSLFLEQGVSDQACTYDFMRDLELYPASEKTSFLGRGTWQLGGDHQLFAEVTYADAKTWYVGTSNRIDAEVPVPLIPELQGYGLADDDTITVRARLLEAGRRKSELTSTGERYVLGVQGLVAGWDYDAAYNHSVNTVKDKVVDGYLLYNELLGAIEDGRISVLRDNDADARALLDSFQVTDTVRRARGTMDSADLKLSRPLMRLDGGDMGLALGAELRRERAEFRPSALLLTDNILGESTPFDARATDDSRKVAAVFAEVQAPVTKALELQAALRHDHYQGVGGSTNPKVGAKYTALPGVTLRGSAGTGFRAPSLSDLYRPPQAGSTSILLDPVCLEQDDYNVWDCSDFWTTQRYSNPDLKPEKSRQFSLGMVLAPSPQWNISLDYWQIRKSNLISELGDDVILANHEKYEHLIHRYNEDEGLCDYDPEDPAICYIEMHKENRGAERAAGLDVVLDWQGRPGAWGRFGARLVGTWMLQSEKQTGDGDPFVSNLGRFVTDGVVQRWRHNLAVDWEHGPWSVTVDNTYLSAYEDQNLAPDPNSGEYTAPNRVKAYSLWGLSGAWAVDTQLTVRAGVKNLFDTAPPFSNQAYFFISGYDPSYTDPRGRFFYASLNYKFK
ncbi:TonB-dependent receptor [Ideonella sp.]|uniref:TonB-dependent receptor n=1 Tax=Ideonella sp. TaxID=1929293 RepID=UPI0035B2300B